MTHFSHVLTINRLAVMTHLGFYDAEREKRQLVEILVRFYFPEEPECCRDDHAKFLDYGAMCEALHAWATEHEFRLVEFMGKEAFRFLRAYVDSRGFGHIKLWIHLTKCNPPVPHLQAGASFVYSDLPPGATVTGVPVL